jgi:hypothetical protein
MIKKMTENEARIFVRDRCKWKDYKSIDDYVEDVVVCLVYSPWHYTEKEAREQCEERMNFIKQSFKEKMPADDCSADVGYCCG